MGQAEITARPESQPKSYSYYPLTILCPPPGGGPSIHCILLMLNGIPEGGPPSQHRAGFRLLVLSLLLQTVPHHLPILVHGMAPEKGNFRGVLAIDLCSDKILVKTPAHSTSQGGVENPLQVLLFSLCKHSQLYMPIAIMSQQLLMK